MVSVKDFDATDVIILEADGLIDQEHGYGTPIHRRLQESDINSMIFPVQENVDRLGDLPSRPMILSGGMTEVTADIEWIRDLKSFILEIIKSNREDPSAVRPVFGICFGAQIIAECYRKGSVRYLDDPEIGISNITLDRPEHPLFKGMPHVFDAYSFHYNQIWSEDVTIISNHVHKGHHFLQAFEVPDAHAFGVQFHPEFKQSEMLKLYKTYESLIADLGFDLRPVIETLPEITGNHLILKNFIDAYCWR